jgi:hypothetical protein
MFMHRIANKELVVLSEAELKLRKTIRANNIREDKVI